MELQQLLSLLEVFSVRVQNYWKKVKATLSLSLSLFLSPLSLSLPLSLSVLLSLSLSVLKVACHWFLDIFHFLSCPSGIHPTTISESFQKASTKAVEILTEMSTPVALSDRESLLKSAMTSLSSKVSALGSYSWIREYIVLQAVRALFFCILQILKLPYSFLNWLYPKYYVWHEKLVLKD